jgi:hypothetical protein
MDTIEITVRYGIRQLHKSSKLDKEIIMPAVEQFAVVKSTYP